MNITVSWFVVTRMRELKIHAEIYKIFSEGWIVMTDGGYEDEFDDTSIFENKSGLAEVRF